MAPASAAIDLDELARLARAPLAEAVSPLDGKPYLLLSLSTPAGDYGVAPESMARWLRRQPCPVIGIADDAAPASLQRACDLIVQDVRQAEPVLDGVERSPLASTVLVQVLRATEHLAPEQALVVESLAYATLQGGPEFRRWLARRPPPHSPQTRRGAPPVIVERNGGTLDIRLNRPERRNALSVEMRDALCEALELVVADVSIESARLSGNGPCFSSGGDLDEFGTTPDPATAHAVRSLRLPAATLLQCAGRVDFRVHGACIGAGAELPAFGASVSATHDAYFQLPEIRFGLIPGAGGCVSIPRRIGRQRTAYMALSGERVDASTALAWGLVDAIVD